ncbi:MobF family relaxase, partial [Salinispora cortesiana]|uniref:MobF family relaxase n=1 Tax=Salinispora cortesiana TaxID=1305843 RepID=UPI0004714EB2
MAWVTTLGPAMQQIDYRLKSDAGCSLSADNDSQVQYRLESDRPLEWVGEGLREVGIEPGSVLDEAGIEAARALADGRDPRTGEVLVAPKMAVHPEAKLDAAPLVEAVRKAAADAGIPVAGLLSEPRQVARYGRLLRGVARAEGRAGGAGSSPETVAHRAPVRDLEAVAKAAGIDLAEVYDRDQLEHARRFADARVAVGNRGYDLTLDLPKSYSVLMAMAPPETAAALENTYLEAVRETVTAVQGWAGYAMRGHHGDGQRAERVDGTGLLGWMTVHRTARPVPGAAPDPHLHAHVTLLNLVRGVDGRWSTVGAGGRDIHRHAAAADAFMKARLRELTHQRWGIGWARNERTGAWEIAAVPERLREVFAKRSGRVAEQLQADGHDPEQATTAQAKQAAAKSREAKLTPGASVDLREDWHRQAAAVDVDPAALMAEAMPGPGRPAPEPMPVAEVAGHVFRAEQGLTGHRKVTTTADVLAAVMDAQPGGISDLQQAETLTDQVLAEPVAVSLPPAGAVHLSNASRYTSVDIVDAERTVLTAARDRFAAGYAAVDATQAADAIGLFELGNRMTFSPQQRAVLDRLLTGGHGLDTVIGAAGAGKTTLMSALRTAHALADHHVAGAATAAVAAQNLQREAQIPSRTVASWLWRIEHGEGLRGVDVLVVDEAAMVDDRDMARLLTAAGQSGTQVIAIGDPLQLKAPGVGGTFAAAHALVAGLELSENRRQVDTDERAALALWRDDQRRAALRAWNSSGRLHVTATPEQAREAIVAEWAQARTRWDDPHDRIAQLLLLAHRNVDVDDLNDRARQARVSAGELGTGHTWQLADGRTLTLAVGDQVLARTNNRDAGVLNG